MFELTNDQRKCFALLPVNDQCKPGQKISSAQNKSRKTGNPHPDYHRKTYWYRNLPSLPSTIIADNSLYYGEFPIIGNIPISDNEDYPMMYGRSVSAREHAVCYQHGKIFRKIENADPLYTGHRNSGVSFKLNVELNFLKECIETGSNDPYWQRFPHQAKEDLRSPQNAEKLPFIRKQFGLQ